MKNVSEVRAIPVKAPIAWSGASVGGRYREILVTFDRRSNIPTYRPSIPIDDLCFLIHAHDPVLAQVETGVTPSGLETMLDAVDSSVTAATSKDRFNPHTTAIIKCTNGYSERLMTWIGQAEPPGAYQNQLSSTSAVRRIRCGGTLDVACQERA